MAPSLRRSGRLRTAKSRASATSDPTTHDTAEHEHSDTASISSGNSSLSDEYLDGERDDGSENDEEFFKDLPSEENSSDVEMADGEAGTEGQEGLLVNLSTSRQDTSQHPPDRSSRKRKAKDFVSPDNDDESAQHAVRVKLPCRNRNLQANRPETPQHDTEMEDPVTDSYQDDNDPDRTHGNALDGLQSTEQSPNKAVDVSIDSPVGTTLLLRVGSSRSELEATLQDFDWRKSVNDDSHYVYKLRADIHLFDDRFILSGNKTEYFNLWHRYLQKFIHEEEDSVDKSAIAAAVPQRRKFGTHSTLTPYTSMTVEALVRKCGERIPAIPTTPDDPRSTRKYATGPVLIDRLRADDDAHHQQEESKNAVALGQSLHENEALDDLQFKCKSCPETKPRSDFMRIIPSSKEVQQLGSCNAYAEKAVAQRLGKKEDALKERTQFMRNNYPDELGIGELSTRDLTQCMLCNHFYIKGFDREEHRKTCPLLNKMCNSCNRGFPNEVWQADHHSQARCEEVRAQKKHQREEAKGDCHFCCLRFPLSHDQFSLHVTACRKEHTLCTPCGRYFKEEQIDDHECIPPRERWRCKNCKRWFKIEYASLHQQEGCKERFGCGNCCKYWDTAKEKEEHDCISAADCPRCGKSGFRKDERALHVENCTMKQCGRCRKFGFPKDDFQAHYNSCPWRFCQSCQRPFESLEALGDHICHKHLCRHCGKMIPEDDHVCEFRTCKKCSERMPKADYHAHKAPCTERLHIKQEELREKGCCSYLYSHGSKLCPNTPVEDLGLCLKHASVRYGAYENTAMEKSQLQKFLFTDEALLAALPKLRRLKCATAVTKYMDILKDDPERALKGDIEGNVGAEIKSPFQTFQLTIKNGKGEVVVPQTVIDHGDITKEQLLRLSGANRNSFVRGSFEKYYGDPSQERATGRVGVHSSTWSEIAVQLEVYRKERGLPEQEPFLAFVDWSLSHLDFDAIKAGLASVKPEHLAADMIKAQSDTPEKGSIVKTRAMIKAGLRLTEEGLPSFKPEQLLPANPGRGPKGAAVDFNPLLWWRVFKRTLGLTKGSRDGNLLLNLSNFFSILYPDERRLVALAHDSDPDVEMLFKVLRFTRILWQEGSIDGRLGRHLTKNGVAGPTFDDDILRKIEEEELEAIAKEGETEREVDTDKSGEYVDEDDTGASVDE